MPVAALTLGNPKNNKLMKRIGNTIKNLLFLGTMALVAACSDRMPDAPEPSKGEVWTPRISRSVTGGSNLLVVLENGEATRKGQLQPATTEGGTATWIGEGLEWPASGTVKLTTFCPYPQDGNLPVTVSSDANTAYQVDYAEADAANKVTGFALTHLMAQLRVHIKVAENDTHPVPSDAVIDLFTTATVDYGNKALTHPADAKAVPLGTFGKEEGKDDGDDNWVNAVQVVIPQDLPVGERCIHFTAGGQEFHFTPDYPIKLVAGYITHIFLGVAMNQPDTPVTLKGITVTDWADGGTLNGGEAEEE